MELPLTKTDRLPIMQNILRPKGIQTRFCRMGSATIAAGVLLALACNSEAAGKSGGGGTTKDQPIDVQLWLDDVHPVPVIDPATGLPADLPNGVVGDGLPYRHGQDRVSAQIMPDQNINVHTAQFNKPPIRHFLLNGGFPPDVPPEWVCPTSSVAGTSERPVFDSPVIPISMFQIYGQNHDDTPSGLEFIRHVNARLVITDDTGRTWTVRYGSRLSPDGFQYAPGGSCMSVVRLPKTDEGKSRWRFWTEGTHLGYLYLFEGNPVREVFAGVVVLPMSGTFESLTVEPEPSSSGYTVPEDPPDCPECH